MTAVESGRLNPRLVSVESQMSGSVAVEVGISKSFVYRLKWRGWVAK